MENKTTPLDEVMGQLACGAFFFGLQSCEYLTVTGKRKTKRLQIKHIRFSRNKAEVTDKRSALILYADSVSIIFRFQKNKKKNITVTQPQSGDTLCPVIMWATIVRRILSYKGSTLDTYINAYQLPGTKVHYVKATNMMKHLKATVNVIGKDKLGFDGDEVGTHSIHSSLAMSLYLKKRMISTIMLIGRWSSDAFLLYIRRQVQEFSAGVTSDMVN